MKKLLLMMFALVLLVPFIGGQNKASAYEGGLLQGKTLIDKDGQNVMIATDGDMGTAIEIKGTGASNYLKYTFPGPTNITGFQTYYDAPVYATLEFFNANGQSLGPITLDDGWGNKHSFSTPKENVSEIRVYGSSGAYIKWYEFDLFGTTSIPQIVEPSSLVASPSNTAVELNWSAATGATSYNIKRSTTAGGPYTTIATAVTGTTSTDTGLTNGTTYYYVVTAVNSGGESGNSNEASATPTAPTSSGRALLTIHLVGGTEKEYDLSATELDNFLDWTESATQNSKYKFVKTWNKGPFKARAEYVVFGKIVNFDVDEYDPAE